MLRTTPLEIFPFEQLWTAATLSKIEHNVVTVVQILNSQEMKVDQFQGQNRESETCARNFGINPGSKQLTELVFQIKTQFRA